MPRVLAAVYDRVMARSERAGLSAWRGELLAELEGRVLELGAGTGVNLSHYPGDLERLILTEPDPHMLRRLVVRARELRPGTEVVGAGAERLPYPGESFDAIVTTLVLCTVPDPDAALAEAARLLRPGGRLLFVEHVASPDPSARRWQGRIEPVWRHVAGGCRLTRDPRQRMRELGFRLERCDEDRLPRSPFFVRPAIRGVALKP